MKLLEIQKMITYVRLSPQPLNPYRAVVGKFRLKYLGGPNEEEIARIMTQNETRGFSKMLRSIECMHWSWRNYPFAWQKICTKGSGR
jgi:hypothetical protein